MRAMCDRLLEVAAEFAKLTLTEEKRACDVLCLADRVFCCLRRDDLDVLLSMLLLGSFAVVLVLLAIMMRRPRETRTCRLDSIDCVLAAPFVI